MRQKITIHDIARELNVTVSTVSRALNDHPAISEGTRSAVKDMAKRLNYRQNKLASSLRSGKSFIIGVIIPSAEISFFGSVVHGIEKVANAHGYNVLLFQSNELPEFEERGIEAFIRSRVDGIIASIAKETTDFDHYREIRKNNIPLIFFDRANPELGAPGVTIDDYRGAYIATEHLIEQGYRRIAHISGQQHIRIFNERLRGYVDALRKHSIPLEDDLIVYGKVSIESGRACMKHLLGLKNRPDAVFAVEDYTALGAMQMAKENNIRIPEEMGFIGFANESFSQFITPGLSSIDQQNIRMGEDAARLFMQLIANRNEDEPQPENIILNPVLVVRESSQRKT
ncbi:MAG: LacI family DNA-binding transcriptional regulator [Mucilaginibacter polytrichastri]|nr:LacI family DNA-binding transcriptional regulator [Mucilaginibacter polytrichastri]